MATTDKETIVGYAKEIITQYAGMRLTLRQLYYRILEVYHAYPNTLSSYKRLGGILVDARKAGSIPYEAIEDRTRGYITGDGKDRSAANHFLNYYEYTKDLDRYYDMPKWFGQPNKVVVFVEKEALASLFQEITSELGIDLVVCRGYSSLTQLWDAAKRLGDAEDDGKSIFLKYFGDFDPSGTDIQRYAAETIEDEFGVSFEIERIAITKEQIRHYKISPAPAKVTDSRYESFVAEHGVAWQVELDAIEPRALQGLIREAIDKHFDQDLGDERDVELKRRKGLIKGWVSKAFDKKFKPPEHEDEDEGEDEDDEEEGGDDE